MITLHKNFNLRNNINLLLRNGVEGDVEAVTQLVRSSFAFWKQESLSLSPMYQKESDTKKYLSKTGFIVEESGAVVATFDTGKISIELQDDGLVSIKNELGLLRKTPLICRDGIRTGQFLTFKKVAVKNEMQKIGIGRLLLDEATLISKEMNLTGVALETVREAVWLYRWYIKMGFKDIAEYKYPSSQLQTVLMIREF